MFIIAKDNFVLGKKQLLSTVEGSTTRNIARFFRFVKMQVIVLSLKWPFSES